MSPTAANDNRSPTLAEIRAQRSANRRKIKTASPAVLALRQRMDQVLAAMATKLESRH